MWRLVVITFCVVLATVYELSGGAEFVPKPKEPGHFGVVARADISASDLGSVAMARYSVMATTGEYRAFDPNAFFKVIRLAPRVAPAVLPVAKPQPDLRAVAGRRVNMRSGPGTEFHVLARLTRGDPVEVLGDPGNGWLKLRVVDSQRIGWMYAALVANP